MSGQVALARRARRLEALVLALFAVVAMAGVSYASIRTYVGASAIPDGILRAMVLASAGFWGIPLAATTVTALWLARRDPMPRAWIHWALTVGAGLLMYPLADRVSARFDMVNAVADGSGRQVIPPTPHTERLWPTAPRLAVADPGEAQSNT